MSQVLDVKPGPAEAPAPPPSRHPIRRIAIGIGVIALLAWAGVAYGPSLMLTLRTASTDDAYVNGHVTFVAPRVAGQVAEVLVDDNFRVKKGDPLVRVDREPFLVRAALKRSALTSAEADRVAAEATVRGLEAQARAQRWRLQNAMEQVSNQVASLRAAVATLQSRRATLDRAKTDFDRERRLLDRSAVSKQEFDQFAATYRVADAEFNEGLEEVRKVRVSLGLPAQPEGGDDLTAVPADLDQSFSTVRSALAELIQTTAMIGMNLTSSEATPRSFLENFRKMDAQGNVDRILERLLKEAPQVKQAEAKLLQARHDLEQAELDLRYCDIVAEIDGVVLRRNVNPGNFVQVGQQIMAVRSITEVWVDANFKETQLASIRIGHRADIHVDMYGDRRVFKGRVSGFTMGTGSTLALLPAQNATGNFVKVVQRLPVRIELVEGNPDDAPLFIGLSVVPYVFVKEEPTGPDAGKRLQSGRPDDRPSSKAPKS